MLSSPDIPSLPGDLPYRGSSMALVSVGNIGLPATEKISEYSKPHSLLGGLRQLRVEMEARGGRSPQNKGAIPRGRENEG